MNSKLVKSNKSRPALLGLPAMLRTRPQRLRVTVVRRLSVVALLMLLAFIPTVGFAHNVTYYLNIVTNWYNIDLVTNWPGKNYWTQQTLIQTPLPDGARWGIVGVDATITNIHNSTRSLPEGATTYYTIPFRPMTDYYIPVSTGFFFTADTNYTYNYTPYLNTFSVVVTGITTAASATWQLTAPDEYTNSSYYSAHASGWFTNKSPSYTVQLTPIPTGQYSMAFNSVRGHKSPPSTNVNITGAPPNWFSTNTYIPYSNSLSVVVSGVAATSKVSWSVSSDNPDWTNMLSSGSTFTNTGTAPQTLSMIPTGTYTVIFNGLLGYANSPAYIITNITGSLAPSVTSVYSQVLSGFQLVVHIGAPFARQSSLQSGIGSGPCGVDFTGESSIQGDAFKNYTVTASDRVVLTALTNYVYKWYITSDGEIDADHIISATPFTNVFSFSMTADKAVWLLYSKPYNSYDNAGDIDQDKLPDHWENNWWPGPNTIAEQLAAPMAETNGNANANPDGDWIPSKLTNAPARISIETNIVSYFAADGSKNIGYPLYQGLNFLVPADGVIEFPAGNFGYSKGAAFDNQLEARGLDGYYQTNGPSGVVTDDDPYTNPTSADTDGDNLADGWEYYFWYWRADNGLPNSAKLWWVQINPSEPNDPLEDTDGDLINDGQEYTTTWTDPTHCDTDGDGMDDYWEIQNFGTNALDYANARLNPDGDYYATVTNLFVLTPGMAGTLFTNAVCYSGPANNPVSVWVNIYTNTGTNVFDLYRDTIIKATVALTNRQIASGTYTNRVYYGAEAGLSGFKQGYPVWVDVTGWGVYVTNWMGLADYALVNPPIKHEAIYLMPPENPFPGVTSFDPRTAWNHTNVVAAHPNTVPYNNYQEYLGGDYLGRLEWDAGGLKIDDNDNDGGKSVLPRLRTAWTNPNKVDTDSDTIEDGWELYVGLNPNYFDDAGLDGDEDGLVNSVEWANVYGGPYANTNATVGATDPGVLFAPLPNDPHPRDTDWDGLGDSAELGSHSNPTCYDTDADGLPDGWEIYAGTSVTNADATVDSDGDGLLNYQEYWTGTVPEWQYCDATWGVNFLTRKIMPWDWTATKKRWFIPPDFLTDGSFMYYNISTNVAWLREHYPATNTIAKYEANYLEYHTTKANNPDSDGDGMDDFWEVYHGLNPNKGLLDMMMPAPDEAGFLRWSFRADVDDEDADYSKPGFQVGSRTNAWPTAGAFNSLSNMVDFVNALPPSWGSRWGAIADMVGPFNFGLEQMDPDGDGLPNLDEYSYSPDRTFYHTDPTPIWRTDSKDPHSFVNLNYGWDFMTTASLSPLTDYLWNDEWPYMFRFEEKEGFDTDNDGVGDFAEKNAAAGELGDNPLDERNPIRSRALYVNGTTDFVRTPDAWTEFSESYLTKFCVEAWIKPDNPARAGDQVVLEKAGLYDNPYHTPPTIVRANFRLGITNGLPYVLYNGRGSLQTYQATAQIYRLSPGVWAHIAGVYDGATLTLYVNGEFSMSLRTTELPATGVNSPPLNDRWYTTPHSIMIGARDLTCGQSVPTYDALGNSVPLTPASYFAGCIDEVRIWDGARSQAQVIANKNRRIPRSEMTNSTLVHYYSFDEVPDPWHRNSAGALDEPVAPAGLTSLDTTMSFHPPMTWWVAHPQRSTVYTGLNGAYNYLVSAADHVAHMSRLIPMDDPYHFSTNYTGTNGMAALQDYNNFSNPYEMPADFGMSIIQDMFMFLGARGVATNSWLDGLDPNNPDSTDTDGDGLPDWWEQKYGLDPNDATGDNGAWGDPDHDGLNNRAEYLAGTNPLNSDTYGTGIGDYDYPRGVYSRTYGEIYTDGDGMPDVWESEHGLDPQKYDANLDLDGDGWSNYAEYQAGTDPNNKYDYPQPLVSGVANYYGSRTGMLRFYAYEINTMDGVPQITKVGTDSQVAEVVGQANGTMTFTGVLPIKPIDVTTVVHISATLTNNVFVTFTFTGPETYTYSGVGTDYSATLNYVNGRFTLRWASAEVPLSGVNVSVEYSYVNRNAAVFSLSGFKEGDFYMLSLLDTSGNGSFDVDEPMGIMDNQPAYLSYSSISGIRVLLTDTRPGFGRFAWTGSTATNAYPVVVNKLSENGAPTILQRAMTAPRNYFHEWDFRLAGIEGLMAGTYQWWMGSQNGTFSVNWPASLAQPALVYPRGDVLYNAQNQFAWTMDWNCPRAHFQVARGAADGALVTDKYIRTPWMDAQGVFRGWLDEYASDWGNGVYYWRVAGWTPQAESAWSDWQTFHVDLSAVNSRWVSGDIYYFGKAPATKIIVEAFDNRGFGGRPVARMALTPSASTGWVKCSYTLHGLEQGAYFVRAFLDVTPAGGTGPNNQPDAWESVGFYRDAYNFYQAGLVDLGDVQFMSNAKIVIRDKDTDNDKLPDAWEMAYFGNLDQTGDMDYDGDGESNLEEYIKDGVNQNPACWDTDGDGLSDGFEPHYNGAAFGFAKGAKAGGTMLNPNVWDTDGDGYSDGAELLRYHTDPLDSTSYPLYRPLCTDAWSSPGDYDGDGRSDIGVYDSNVGVWSLITMAGQPLDLPFGIKGAQPMVGDYTGDGRSDFAFYDKGLWTICDVWSGQSGTMKLGGASMLPVPADYTGDGRVDLAVFDTVSGIWYIYDIWSGALFPVQFGASGMIPVPGDYNGDGSTDLAVYEPATGNWMLGCLHKYYRTWTTYSGTFGGPTWMPVPGDYDGDGRNDACLFESNTGRWMLFTLAGQFAQGTFGWPGCVPVPGDYDGDGRTDLCLYDTNTGMWYIICMSGAYYEGRFGGPGALPILKGR